MKKNKLESVMKVRDFILQFIFRACVVCVAVSLLFFAVATIVRSNSLDGELGISFSQYALFFLFSLLLTGAGYVFRLNLHRALRILIHFLITGVCFFIMFAIAGKLNLGSFGGAMIFFVLFALLYALFFGAYALLKYLLFPELRKPKKAEEHYEKRF
jgi:hypothetical protein